MTLDLFLYRVKLSVLLGTLFVTTKPKKKTTFMINTTEKVTVIHSSEPVHRINMGEMDAESIAFMLEQSRDGFYSNKILAPLREYSTNARDSHVQSGIPTTPIEVTLPTVMEPELKIRDFGAGLDISDLSNIYFKYWKSTKRNTNEQNGFYGIGSKSGFAIADCFTVISICNGMKYVITGQKNGWADIIYSQPSDEKSGIEVIIPIQQTDIPKFHYEALNFFKYWDIRPVIKNIEPEKLTEAFNVTDTKAFLEGSGWAIRPCGYGNGETVAIMGFIPYKIDWEQVKNNLATELFNKISGIFTFLQENLTTLTFDNGSLAFTPNRESLQYNDVTVNELSKKLTAIYDSLLNLITSKVSDAANLWEAKIRYNMIFRKELDGFDKAFVYGGNLQTIERLLNNRIQWNGITITNGMFEGLSDWCAIEGKVGNYKDDSFTPVLTTYVKNDNKTGVVAVKTTNRRRRRYGYGSSTESKIICSPKSVVLIQDTDKPFLAKGLAAWMFYKSGMDISQVYVLDLHNAEVKDEFYKEFNFETVPVKSVGDNEGLIKSYLKSIRAPRSTAGNSLRGVSRPLNCPYVVIENRKTTGGYLPSYVSWGCEDVNARGLDGGDKRYYVVYSKKSFTFNGKEILHEYSSSFWQSVYDLALTAGVNLDKVFGIHRKTAESNWFKESIEEGDWINLFDFVTENTDCLPKDIIKKMSAYFEAEENRVGLIPAQEMLPMLSDVDGIAAKYFGEISEFSKHIDTMNIPKNLRIDGFEHEETDVELFRKTNEAMRKKYPLMFKTNRTNALYNCIPNSSDKLDFPTIRELTEYVNLIDLHS